VLSAQESDIRPFSDDQNIVIGYACGDERTNYLPVAHWISGELGRRLFARVRGDADLSAIFGPDFKILASLEVTPGKRQVEWHSLVLSIQHIPRLPYERQHRILLPLLEQILRDLEASGLEGTASTFTPIKLILNGAGEFAIGGPEGDNGLSGKKLVIDHYGPSVPIGGGALAGKDPHKVDKCGALRARQLAKKLVRKGVDEARVLLGWTPGGDTPFLVEASTNQGSVNLQVPRGELPSEEWFSIKAIVRDLELAERDWAADLRGGYFCQASAPWER
jgi:S-adenosylmethionine synthetase